MPLRSPKMNSFILGFQRLVWWPKCTPASNSSCIEIPLKLPPECARRDASRLTLAELEALARSRHAVLLAFLRAGVARQEAAALERLAQFGVGHAERAGDAEAQRAGLSGHAAAAHGCQHVVAARHLGDDEGLLDLGPQRFGGEELVEFAMIYRDGTAARSEIHARGCGLATACAVVLSQCHVLPDLDRRRFLSGVRVLVPRVHLEFP